MQPKLETMRLQLREVADDDVDGVGRIMESAIVSGIDRVLMEMTISRRRGFVRLTIVGRGAENNEQR